MRGALSSDLRWSGNTLALDARKNPPASPTPYHCRQFACPLVYSAMWQGYRCANQALRHPASANWRVLDPDRSKGSASLAANVHPNFYGFAPRGSRRHKEIHARRCRVAGTTVPAQDRAEKCRLNRLPDENKSPQWRSAQQYVQSRFANRM